MDTGGHPTKRTSVRKDLFAILAVSAVTLILAVWYDLFDVFVKWYVRQEEPGVLEEVIVVVLVLPFSLGVFSYRRWRDVSREISDRKRVEEALREREARYRLLFERSPLGVFTYDRNLRLTECNDRYPAIMRTSRERLIGLDLNELADNRATPLLRLPIEGRQATFDGRYRTTISNVDVWISAYAAPLYDGNGEIVGGMAIVDDVSERKALENRLLQSQKMEAVGRLGAGIAHDLNNLLTPILGYSEMLLEDLDSTSEVYNQVKSIHQAGECSRDLIRQLLAFSRKQVLEVAPVDLCRLVLNMGMMLRRTIREDIVIDTRLSPEPCPAMVDMGQITQVLVNLAVNAQDAMPHGGTLTIDVSTTVLDEEFCRENIDATPGKYALLAISDTGCGMDRTTQQQIFEPFFTTKKSMGTGLGLATVYGVVKQHGGYIRVDSEPDRGSIFRVYLPAAGNRTASVEAEPEKLKLARGTETILVAEDNSMTRDLVCSILRFRGYRVLEAGDGRQAVEHSDGYDGPVHLLLTDVIMPDMNGKVLFEQLRRSRPELRVVFMSGYTDNIIAAHGVLEEGLHLIRKPFEARELLTKVRRAMDQSRR